MQIEYLGSLPQIVLCATHCSLVLRHLLVVSRQLFGHPGSEVSQRIPMVGCIYESQRPSSHGRSRHAHTPMMVPNHALIVGGGLAGPALAIGLARQGIKSTIFEIRDGPVDAGGAIMLAPNALKVLDKIFGLYGAISQVGFTFEDITLASEEGQIIGKVSIGDVAGTGYPAIRIKRTVLHGALLKQCAELGDKIEIKYGEKLESVKEGENGVTAVFAGGLTARGMVLFLDL